MTDLDRPVFAQTMNKLCIALREKNPDAVQMRVYFDALQDLEIEFVSAAAERMAKQGGAITYKPDESPHWFPKTSEWRVEAAKVEADRTAELKARLRKLREPLCLECDDTGFARDVSNRVKPCTCRSLRRLEVLGRRPMPQLPSGDAA